MGREIISASRRTDIPAFYSQWFINRVRAGYCHVTNPYNLRQVSAVSLRPEDVAFIVFWSKNPAPLLPYLSELDERGFNYYFQITLTGYGPMVEPHVPSWRQVAGLVERLAAVLGPERIVWRYDPIVLGGDMNLGYHCKNFARLADALAGKACRVVVSLVDSYVKVQRRMPTVAADEGLTFLKQLLAGPDFGDTMRFLAEAARRAGMDILACAEDIDLTPYGIQAGRCVDNELANFLFGLDIPGKRDRSQRTACQCVPSKDIGAYDTCLHGCLYCYAYVTLDKCRRRHALSNAEAPSLT